MPEISAARYRAGEGEPLVLVHGFTATWRCWLPVFAELVPRFDVFAPTLHGHDGGPPLPPGAVSRTMAEAADHLEILLDEAGIDTAHFAGNSMGGALSLELAKRGRARSVVAISPGGGWQPDDMAEVERIVRWFARTRRLTKMSESRLPRVMARPGSRRLAMRDVMTHGELVPPKEAVLLATSSLRCTVTEEIFAALRSGNGHLKDLDQVKAPVLVTWGTKDRILPMAKHGARFRSEIPGVQFRAWPGLGHTPMYDDSGLVASAIADFATLHSGVPAATAAA
jgi:pimeloyl-ACP methyl ester carboxylesterase